MRLVYLAHPLTPTDEQVELERRCYPQLPRDELVEIARWGNLYRAGEWAVWAARQGVAPVATWTVLASNWPETSENRALGLAIDCALVARCDELWLVGGRVSAGMRVEADAARAAGVEVVDLTHLGEEAPK